MDSLLSYISIAAMMVVIPGADTMLVVKTRFATGRTPGAAMFSVWRQGFLSGR